MKTLTKSIMVMTMILILVGSATTAFAQEDTDTARRGHGIRGEVTAKSNSGLTVKTHNGEVVTVNVTGETKIRLVGQGEISLSDIETGNFVGVRGQKKDDGSIDARLILVLEDNPRDLIRAWGKVKAINGDVITIENQDGDAQDITTNDKTKFRKGKEPAGLDDIEIDDPIFAAGKKEDGAFVARLVVVATRDQLRKHTLRGEVLSVDTGSGVLTVEARGNKEGTWTVQTTKETKYRVPGIENPTLADIKAGDHVFVVGKGDEESSKSGTARAIAVIPEGVHDGGARVRGEVTGVDDGNHSFTLHSERGNFTILTDDSTRYRTRDGGDVSFDDIEVGGKVIVLGKKVEGQEHTIQAKLVGIAPAHTDSN